MDHKFYKHAANIYHWKNSSNSTFSHKTIDEFHMIHKKIWIPQIATAIVGVNKEIDYHVPWKCCNVYIS